MSESSTIFIAAGDTARNPGRSGIQSTVRQLVAEFGYHHADRARIAYWNRHLNFLHGLPPQFSLGLAAERIRSASPLTLPQRVSAFPGWFPGRDPVRIPLHRHPSHASKLRGGWLLLPELLYGHGRIDRFVAYARRHGMRIAAIFFDAIPIQHPEYCRPGLAGLHRNYMRELAQVDLVLPISEVSAAVWHEYLGKEGLTSPKVRTIPLAAECSGAARWLTPPKAHEGPVRMLCVATIEPRKNHRTLCEALDRLAAKHGRWICEVDLVGGVDPSSPELTAFVASLEQRAQGQLLWHRRADSATLRHFFAHSDFTIYPSLIEGFGLPVLESLWFARPCICANFGVMAEHARAGGCLTVDVRDPTALAAAIEQLATDPARRQQLSHAAIQRPLKTWSEYADEIVRALDEN